MDTSTYKGTPRPFVHEWGNQGYPDPADHISIEGYWYGSQSNGATFFITAEIVGNDVYFPPEIGIDPIGVTYTIRPGMTSDAYSYDCGGFAGSDSVPTDWPVANNGITMIFEGVGERIIGTVWTSAVTFVPIIQGVSSIESTSLVAGVIDAVEVTAGSIVGDGSGMTGILPDQAGHTGEYLTTDGSTTAWSVGRATWSDVPGSTGATGATGDVAFDSEYMYICVAENYWKRGPISEWP